MKKFVLILPVFISILGCNGKIEKMEAIGIGIEPCAQKPSYISSSPINPNYAALTTNEKRVKGIALMDVTTKQLWQHPSWSKFGNMGPISTDEFGNSYIAPVPLINILDNKPQDQNTIYKIDGLTGEMTVLINLSENANKKQSNPYGLVGLYYDCHSKLLFASSIMGSTKDEELGCIYSIDVLKKEVVDKLEHTDAMGIAIAGVTGEKRLFYGNCRNSEIRSIEIGKKGKFRDESKLEFNLDMLGPRGDDIARKISFNKDGYMVIKGISFDYNLTAPTEKLETTYIFQYDRSTLKWAFISQN